MEILIKVLEKSVEKNGADTPLTLGHLLNIAKIVQAIEAGLEEIRETTYDEALEAARGHMGQD